MVIQLNNEQTFTYIILTRFISKRIMFLITVNMSIVFRKAIVYLILKMYLRKAIIYHSFIKVQYYGNLKVRTVKIRVVLQKEGTLVNVIKLYVSLFESNNLNSYR